MTKACVGLSTERALLELFSHHSAYLHQAVPYQIILAKFKSPQYQFFPLTMSEAFFTQILRTESTVQPDGESCCICLQQYGTIFPESGFVEIEVRLPCNHAFGSACILRWLQNSNTCPICRETFIPPEHRPSSEPAIYDSQEANGDDFFGDDSDDFDTWDLVRTAFYTSAECFDALHLHSCIRTLVRRMIITGVNLLDELGIQETVAAFI